LSLLGFSVLLLSNCAAVNKMHHPDPGLVFSPGEQPDKVLYQKALNETSHARYEVGRLTLQTLINTYPDSEYLSRAKLAIADSYYNEGGISGLTQAEAEYKDFITFFPTAPESPEAQYRIGMAHVRQMAKADRDQTEAKLADAEFKEFLLKYPDSPLIPRVKGRLRQVQEVLAQGEYYTANYYYTHNAFPAARSRFQTIIEKYPDFSGGDTALYYLGQSLEHLKKGRDAIPYYSQVITTFPLSPLVPQAKERLIAMKAPVPHATRAALARAQADASHRVERTWLGNMGQVFSSAPDTSATLYGPVHLGGVSAATAETAKEQQVATPPATTIVATPVSDKSLETEKPAPTTTVATPDKDTANSKDSTSDKDQSNTAKPAQPDSSSSSQPEKKKGKFHVLKKIIKPL
jgi:outer membrane protein assembly factor BamD